MNNDNIYLKLKKYYPLHAKENKLPTLLAKFIKILDDKIVDNDYTRLTGNYGKNDYQTLINKYSNISKNNFSVKKINLIVNDFFSGTIRWRSPNTEHNIGAPVNSIASAIYSLSLDENIYNIDDSLAGNVIFAEATVSKILSNLADLDKPAVGLFTFGGTATNLYASKVGLKKAIPKISEKGRPNKVKAFVTRESHYSHVQSADWLGIGTSNVITINSEKNGQTSVRDTKKKMIKTIESGDKISSIILNGGTTYNHTIDEIKTIVDLRNDIMKKYELDYKPHIHVDSVIGWSWLFFRKYDFINNILGIEKEALKKIKRQMELITAVKFADSWSADFHKGVGSCPIPSSIVLFNDENDINLLSKKNKAVTMHQLAPEFNFFSPADYTLETSRPGGAALSALATMNFLGDKGFQRNLANLVEQTTVIRKALTNRKDIYVANNNSLGFVTMVRLYPLALENHPRRFKELIKNDKKTAAFVQQTNEYMKSFFEWDFNSRIKKNIGASYSFSSAFYESTPSIKISAIKIYPVSPHFNENYAKKTAETLIKQKVYYDNYVYRKNF